MHARGEQSLKDSYKTRNGSLERSLGGLLDEKAENEEHLGKVGMSSFRLL